MDGPTLKALAKERLFLRCRMALIVTGPVDAEAVSDLLFDSLDLLPEGDCSPSPQPPVQFGRIMAVQDGGPMEAMSAIMPAPDPGSMDAFAVHAAARILAAKFNERIVGQIHLAVGADFRYVTASPAHLRMDFTGPRMLQAAEWALSEIRQLRDQGISATALDSAKAWLVAERQMSLESAASWAQQAAEAEMTGAWQNHGNPGERAAALQPSPYPICGAKIFTRHLLGFCRGYNTDG
jgi:predicted Zn-dependent peptidase